MAIQDYTDWKTANKLRTEWWQQQAANAIAGTFSRSWNALGTPGAAIEPTTGSATPGMGGNTHVNEAGTITFPNMTGTKKFLSTYGGKTSSAYSLHLFDHLVGVGSISVATTGDKDVNTVALPRYTTGDGVIPAFEVVSGTATFTIALSSYTNESGVSGRAGSAIVVPGTNVSAIHPFNLQAGDLGCQSIQTVNVSVAGAATTINVILLYPITSLVTNSVTASEVDHVLETTALQRIYDGASLTSCGLRKGSVTGATFTQNGYVTVIYG